ncbi:MAG TPA: YdcF family protein [Thermomicrobiales bacterium]|nr:YdcF family protein [Thermomicrobiales bacterium]
MVAAAGILALFLWSWEPAAALFARTLEGGYPIRTKPEGDAEAIVVLTGGIYKHDASMPEDLPQPDTLARASYAAWLYRNWRPLPVLVSGGMTGEKRRVVLAEVARRVVEEKGVPPGMVVVEGRSKSTYENALYSAEILRSKGITRIALVTEAHHMRRAEAAFRRQGLAVVPAPCAYRYIRFTADREQFIPRAAAIEQNELMLHEWVGLLWYRVSGKA